MFQIKEPCTEDWNKMQIGVCSRFCSSCEKKVIDFTHFSKREILEYLIDKKDEQVCGRLRKSQVDFTIDDLFITINTLPNDRKNTNLAFYILTIGALTLASCGNEVEPVSKPMKSIKPDTTIVERIDSLTSQSSDSSDTRSVDQRLSKEDTNDSKETEAIILENLIMGDVMVPPLEPKLNSTTTPRRPMKHPEVMPEFKGGVNGLMKHLHEDIKYPEKAKEMGVGGNVYISFVIDTTGKVKDPKILKGINPDSLGFNEETIRAVSNLPNWKPGVHQGKKVETLLTIPIKFRVNH